QLTRTVLHVGLHPCSGPSSRHGYPLRGRHGCRGSSICSLPPQIGEWPSLGHPPRGSSEHCPWGGYWLAPAAAFFASSSFSASRLKLAPFCSGGNSIKVCAALATSCCTKT